MSKNELLNKYKNERQETLIFTRVMGYYSCKQRFNEGKKQEFNDRIAFNVNNCCPCSK